MGQQFGANVRLVHLTEKTFKSTSTASGEAWVLGYVSESLRLNRTLIDSRSIRSTRNPSQPVRGAMDVAGDVVLELAPEHGRILKHVFGSVTSTTGVAGQWYTHTFKIGALPEGLTIEKQFTDLATPQYFRYNGLKVNTFKLSAKASGFIECTVSFMGARETVAAATGFTGGAGLDIGLSQFDGMNATVQEGSPSPTTLGVATEVDFTLENGLDGNTYVMDGTGERYSLPTGTVKVSGTLKCLFDSVTLYNKAINFQTTKLVIILQRGTGAGTADNEKLTLYFDELIFTPQSPVVTGPTGLLCELPFVAFYDSAAEASAIRAIMLSPQMSYY